MRKYVFMTYPIDVLGGSQLYTAKKAAYLRELGWSVLILHCGLHDLNPMIGITESAFTFPFLRFPPFLYSSHFVHLAVDRMCVAVDISEEDEVIIEAHADTFPQWGELLASKIGAKCVSVPLNELFRGHNKYYEYKLDFFRFKYDRGELFAGKHIGKLFDDEKEYQEIGFLINEAPVADVSNEKVERVQRKDYNICYIGRIRKNYVGNILSGVSSFAAAHEDRSIQMLFVGDISGRRKEIEEIFAGNGNLTVCALGDLVPIPKALFDKIDVVIAGSGSARCAVEQGALTIVADAENCMSNGLLGYETQESIKPEKTQTSFSKALERVLIQRVQNTMQFHYTSHSVAECCGQNFAMIYASDQNKLYYDENALLGRENIKAPTMIRLWCGMLLATIRHALCRLRLNR